MTITITGREIFPSDGNPIIGADVYIYQSDTGTLVDQTTTDANGAWTFTIASYALGYNTKVVYGQGIRWDYVAQEIQAQSVIIDGSITVRNWAHASDLTKIDGGDLYVGSTIELASSGHIRSGQTAYNTGTGWWIGDVGGTPKASMGVAAGAGWTWDGAAFSVTGAITATSGSIGSFTIGTYLYTGTKTAWNDANAGVHVGSDGIGIGNNVFTVNGSTGALVATSATISGTITASAGAIGGFTIGALVLSSGATTTSVQIRSDGTLPAFSCGANDPDTAPFRVYPTGVFVATSGTFTGAITASSGSITGPLTMSGASASIAIGTTPPSSATVGTGLWLDRTGLYGLNANTQNFVLNATTGAITAISGAIGGWTLGATTLVGGAVTLDSAGAVSIATNTSATYSLQWLNGANRRAGIAVTRDASDNVDMDILVTSGATDDKRIDLILGTDAGANVGSVGFVRTETGSTLDFQISQISHGARTMMQLRYDNVADAGFLKITGLFYPGTATSTQSTRYIYDDTSNIVVDGMVPATHTHSGAGQGGTVAVASVTGAAPLASPTFTGTVTLPAAGAITGGTLTLSGGADYGALKLVSTAVGAVTFTAYRNDTAAVSRICGRWQANSKDSASTEVFVAYIDYILTDATAGSVDSQINFVTRTNGVTQDSIAIQNNDIYKGATAYSNPDYVFDWWADGRCKEPYLGLLSLPELDSYLRTHRHLPGISREATGLFDRADVVLEKVEEVSLYVLQLHERISTLEAQLATRRERMN